MVRVTMVNRHGKNLLCGCTYANKLLLESGRSRTGFPVAAKIALQNPAPSNVRCFPFPLSFTIGSPSSIQARSEASRLGHKLIA